MSLLRQCVGAADRESGKKQAAQRLADASRRPFGLFDR